MALTLGRPGVDTTLWRFSPATFLMIPITKIASSYLLLGIRDTFWHMWHHLDAVTWHMSWRQMYMTVVKIHCFLPLFVNRDIFWCRCDKAIRLVSFSTESRSQNSKMLKWITWPWQMILKFEVKLPSTCPFITRLVIMMQSWSWCLF